MQKILGEGQYVENSLAQDSGNPWNLVEPREVYHGDFFLKTCELYGKDTTVTGEGHIQHGIDPNKSERFLL